MRLAELVAASRSVAETSGRLEKIDRLAALLKRLEPDEIEVAVAYLSGSTRQGRLGVGGAAVSSAHDVAPSAVETLDLGDVDAAFGRVVAATGAGSSGAKAAILRELFGRATRDEQEFLIRLLFGELRQGALEGVLLEAVARARNAAASSDRDVTRRGTIEWTGSCSPSVAMRRPCGSSASGWPSRYSASKNTGVIGSACRSRSTSSLRPNRRIVT